MLGLIERSLRISLREMIHLLRPLAPNPLRSTKNAPLKVVAVRSSWFFGFGSDAQLLEPREHGMHRPVRVAVEEASSNTNELPLHPFKDGVPLHVFVKLLWSMDSI